MNSNETLHSASPRGGRAGGESGFERDRNAEGPSDLAEDVAQLLIVGCGNAGGDEGVGLEIVRRIASADTVERAFVEPEQAHAEMQQLRAQSPYFLFVDAVVTRSRPGAIHLVSLPSKTLEPRNLDQGSVPPASRAALLGIEIPESPRKEGLSEPVQRAADFVIANFDAIQRQVLEHEHENLPLAVMILAPERDPGHA